jgi:GntR family transcriptional regulator of vanillate catabolism
MVEDSELADLLMTEPATNTVLMQLREQIVNGQIPPGTRLRAEALAAQLDVSRTPIRSALALLSAEGLVSYGVNRGYTVRQVTIGDILDSIETRAALESLACRISVDNGWNARDLAWLAGTVRQSREIVDRAAWSEAIEREWYRLNHLFHRGMLRASRNAVLRNAVRMTILNPIYGDIVRVCPSVAVHVPERHRRLPEVVPDHIRESQTDHEAILAAITAGDSLEAGRLVSEHVLSTKARVHAVATLR